MSWVFLWGRKMPLPNILEFIGTNISQRKFQEAQQKLLNYLSGETATKAELTVKADKTYVDSALAGFTNGTDKFYPTLAEANADIANILPKLVTDTVRNKVTIGEVGNGGTWYKNTYNSTTLTKSEYDAFVQGKNYTDTTVNALKSNITDFLPPKDYGYLNITTVGEVDFVKRLYISSGWTEGSLFLDYLKKETSGTAFAIYLRNSSNTVVMGGNVNESDFNGTKIYTIPNTSGSGFVGKIKIDWSKYNALVDGLPKNRYVKSAAANNTVDNDKTAYTIEQEAKAAEYNLLKADLVDYLPLVSQDYGFVNITTAGEFDFVKKVYVSGTWDEGYVLLDNFAKNSTGFYTYFRNPSNGVLAGGDVIETDYTGIKTYIVPNGSAVNVAGYSVKIQVDWSRYNQLGNGIPKNRYVKSVAHTDFTVGSTDKEREALQNSRITALETRKEPVSLVYKRYINQTITTTDFASSGTLWTIANSTAICINPSETTKLYAKQKYISNKIQHRWTVQLKSDSVVKFGGYVGASYIESTCVLDCVNKKLIINKAGDNSSAPITPRASATIPFSIVDGREYYVTLFRNNRKNSIKLTDTVTGQSIVVTDDWSKVGYTVGSGNMRSQPFVTLASGTSVTVKKYENYLPFGVDVVFGGDSNTESDIDVNGAYQVNWADNLLTEVFNENGVKFAEFGIAFAAWFGCIGEVLAMKPKYFVVNIGTNSATTQAQYQQIVDVCATNNIELILCHNPRDDGSRTYLAQNNLNIDAVNVQTVKFDVATSLNFDLAQPYNSALYKDGVHFNTAGYRVLSDRVLSDVPLLKSS